MSLGQSRHIFLRPLWLSEADVTGQTLISQIRGEFELTRLSGVKSSACHLVSIKRRSHSQQNIGNIHPQVVSMLLACAERAAEKKQVYWAHPEILHRSQKKKKERKKRKKEKESTDDNILTSKRHFDGADSWPSTLWEKGINCSPIHVKVTFISLNNPIKAMCLH